MAFDLKDSRNQKIVLVALVVCLGAYFWYAKVYSPNVARIEAKVAEHERILTDLRNVELKAKSFDALKDEYETLFAQYLEISSLLPDDRQLEDQSLLPDLPRRMFREEQCDADQHNEEAGGDEPEIGEET